MKKTLIISIITALSILGCATNSDRQFSLSQTLLTYEKAIRWGEFEQLLNFRKASEESDLALLGGYDNIRVSGYKVKRRPPSSDKFQTNIDVEISYFKTHDNRINTIIDKQIWQYDEENNRWYITSPLPVFK